MTPKEKAKELFDKYQIAGSQWYVETTIKFALIAVDEILKELMDIEFNNDDEELPFGYWKEVRKELLNMK